MTERVVTLADARKASFCGAGLAQVCQAYGIDFKAAVLRGGIPIKDLRGIEDAYVQKIIRIAEERIDRDG